MFYMLFFVFCLLKQPDFMYWNYSPTGGKISTGAGVRTGAGAGDLTGAGAGDLAGAGV